MEQELNTFLSQHKVVSVQHELMDQSVNSFWAICVDYLTQRQGVAQAKADFFLRKRIDYKEIITPEEFALISRPRIRFNQ